MSTARHVLRIRREALLQGGALGDADVVSYDAADGLLGTGGVKRHRSVVNDAKGRVWFSLNRGLSVVDPGRAIGRSAPAPARVVALTADGRPLDLRGPLRIPSGARRVSFGYAGISLSTPERIRFRYRLDGFDKTWSEPVMSREAVYANLAPGPYRFRVTASRGDGVWSGPEDTVAVVIAPALWQTRWFQLGAVLVAGLLARLVYSWRLGQETRRLNALFEERLAERTRIAQELHDTLLQGFLSASLQLHVAVEQLPEASPTRFGLARVQQLMGQVIDEGRNALRGLRSADQGVGDLAEAFSRVRQDMRLDDATDLRVIVEGAVRELRPEVRDEVYRIGREALSNALRHAHARRVEVELEYGARDLRVLVRDDGCGIDPQILESGREGHWGLSGMRERAERIGGRLRLWSAPGAGTELELRVRSSLAYAGSASSRRAFGRVYDLFHRRRSPGAEGDAP
jgi:signal transduction histidine kinase